MEKSMDIQSLSALLNKWLLTGTAHIGELHYELFEIICYQTEYDDKRFLDGAAIEPSTTSIVLDIEVHIQYGPNERHEKYVAFTYRSAVC